MTGVYDAIIIGAGHNGLVTAAYLAGAGLKVLVLERSQKVGGVAGTRQIFPGFFANIGAPDAGLFRQEIVRDLELEKNGLEFAESEVAVFWPQVGGRGLTLWRDPARNELEIGRFSKIDAANYPAFISYTQAMARVLEEILKQTPPDITGLTPGEVWPWFKIGLNLRRSKNPDMMEFIRVLPLSIRDFLDEWFESEELKGVLALPALSGGMPGPFAAGTMLMFLYQQLGGLNGGYRSCNFVLGGMGRLAESLVAAAKDFGAVIQTNSGVVSILMDGERARGVKMEEGHTLESRLVISSLDPRNTFFNLVGGANLMPHFIRDVRNIRYRGMTAKVHLALSDLPAFQGVEEVKQLSGFITISPNLEYLERAWDDAKYGRISTRPVLEATIPSLLDPSLAPKDKHLLSVTVQYAPYHLKKGTWDDHREELGDLVVSTLAQYAPNLPYLVVNRQVITPLDWECEYGLTEGHIFHGRMELDQLLFMRPIPGFARYRTPFENLYLCGAGTHPGGGVSGWPGFNAAREILRDWD